MTQSSLKASTCAAFAVFAAPSSTAAQAQEETLYANSEDNVQLQVRKRTDGASTMCSLIQGDAHHDTVLMFNFGRTSESSLMTIIAAEDVGSNDGELLLQRGVGRGSEENRASWSKEHLQGPYHQYRATFADLQMDLDDVENSWAFRLYETSDEKAGFGVGFGVSIRDEALAALRSCIASQPVSWLK